MALMYADRMDTTSPCRADGAPLMSRTGLAQRSNGWQERPKPGQICGRKGVRGVQAVALYCRPWCMANLPPTYSKMAESPVGSEIARCTEPASPVSKVGGPRRNGSIRKASTASATVAKLSSTYCGQALIESMGLPSALPNSASEEIGDETFLVHAVDGAGLIGRGDQAAVFRGPFRRV